MTPGDGVCAHGSKTILGWGEITGEYDFDEDAQDFPHRRDVTWESTAAVPYLAEARAEASGRNPSLLPTSGIRSKRSQARLLGGRK